MSRTFPGIAVLAAAATLTAAVPAAAKSQCGTASWYALHSKTASGERMNPAAMTAAHRSLPFGTKIKVTNQRNGKAVMVRVNDRGPFVKGRVLDLSKAAAAALGFVRSGHTKICMERH
jgi:rare lipoprotein A